MAFPVLYVVPATKSIVMGYRRRSWRGASAGRKQCMQGRAFETRARYGLRQMNTQIRESSSVYGQC